MNQMERIESYKIVHVGGCDELVEKKSRFIVTIHPANTEEQAIEFINKMKKKYWDARHNCSAYIIGENAEIIRCSDDGEPSGTAGRPILEVFLGEEIRNVAVVVTRYFGGTLLGTGGLIRAYTKAAQLGLNRSEIVTMRYGVKTRIAADYNNAGKIQYLLGQADIVTYETEYTEQVVFTILASQHKTASLQKKVVEATAAKVKMEEVERLYFIDKKETV